MCSFFLFYHLWNSWDLFHRHWFFKWYQYSILLEKTINPQLSTTAYQFIFLKLHILKQDEATQMWWAEMARMVVLGKPTCRHPLMWTQERWGGIFQRGEKDNPGHCPSPLSRVVPAGPCSSILWMCCPQRRHHLPFHWSRSPCSLPAHWRTWQYAGEWYSSPAHGTCAGCWHSSQARARTGTWAVAVFWTQPRHPLSLPKEGHACPPCHLPPLRQLNDGQIEMKHKNVWNGQEVCYSVFFFLYDGTC